jgi:hypothetical protein
MSDGKQYFTAIHDIHILADNDSILWYSMIFYDIHNGYSNNIRW